jgi:hypothetical protein
MGEDLSFEMKGYINVSYPQLDLSFAQLSPSLFLRLLNSHPQAKPGS